MDYWKECIETAFDEAGITATEEQKKSVIETVEGAHENYGMAFGHDCIPNPLEAEVKQAEARTKAVEKEGERIAGIYKNAFCRKMGLNPEDVGINDGVIERWR